MPNKATIILVKMAEGEEGRSGSDANFSDLEFAVR